MHHRVEIEKETLIKKVIALSAALAAAGAFSASAQETAPTTDPATTPPAATTTETTPPADSGGTGTGMTPDATAPSTDTATTPPAMDSTTPPADTAAETMPPADTDGAGGTSDGAMTDTTTTDGAMTDTTTTDGAMTDTTATDGAMTDGAMTDGAMTVPEGFTLYAGEPMTAENLQDASVYGSDDASIGNISDFVLAEDGAITQVVFDVGGFLGIGARNVAVPFEEVQIYTNADASDMRVYLPMTKEELEALPEYTES